MSRPKRGLNRGQRGQAADGTDLHVTKAARCLGMALLGTLIGGAPDPAAAASRAERHCGPVCQERRSRALPDQSAPFAPSARQAAATATSTLALLQPVRTLTVTTAADVIDPGDGKLSLREALGRANATAEVERIVFAPALEGQTLVLAGGELVVDEDLVIDGDRDDDGRGVTLSGGDRSRVLNIVGVSTDVALTDLTLADGSTDEAVDGACIFLEGGSLALVGSIVRDCRTGDDGDGGGIFATSGSRLSIVGSTIVRNGAARYGDGGGIFVVDSFLTIEDSAVSNNWGYRGGGIRAFTTIVRIARSAFTGNDAQYGGGIDFNSGALIIADSTIYLNRADSFGGGLISHADTLIIRNSTITRNQINFRGGGLYVTDTLDIANSIVAGNEAGYHASDIDSVHGFVMQSNGHNVFGSEVAGSVVGDRENVAASAIFAASGTFTGIIPLKRSLANPALSGGDPLAAGRTDQLGRKRPQPGGSLPDIGAAEIDQPLSTGTSVRNDVILGNAAPNTLAGWAGND
ncbi:MAG: hypothetical protein AB7X49_04805, partial [Geminicoccaceae bacterium]